MLPFRAKDGILSFMDSHRARESKRGGKLVYIKLSDVAALVEGK